MTDANVNAALRGAVKRIYRDVRELITSVKEFNNGATLWTSYDIFAKAGRGANGYTTIR